MRLRTWIILLFAAVLVAGLGCAKPAKVTVTPKQVVLNDAGGSRTLTAAVFDKKDRPMEKAVVTFASSAPEVADVDATGKVTVKGSGETTITAASGKASGECKVIVHIVSSLKFEPVEGLVNGPAGEVVPLKISGQNERGEAADLAGLGFQSSAPEVATVDKEGRLTLLSTGKATIVATIGKSKAELPVEVHILVPAAIKVPVPPVQTLQVGDKAKLDATVISDLGGPMKFPLACTSSAPNVATVEPDGTVTALARGTTEITIVAGTAKNTLKVVVR
jgi:uncharacterized protein YjdB